MGNYTFITNSALFFCVEMERYGVLSNSFHFKLVLLSYVEKK